MTLREGLAGIVCMSFYSNIMVKWNVLFSESFEDIYLLVSRCLNFRTKI